MFPDLSWLSHSYDHPPSPRESKGFVPPRAGELWGFSGPQKQQGCCGGNMPSNGQSVTKAASVSSMQHLQKSFRIARLIRNQICIDNTNTKSAVITKSSITKHQSPINYRSLIINRRPSIINHLLQAITIKSTALEEEIMKHHSMTNGSNKHTAQSIIHQAQHNGVFRTPQA